MATNPPDMTTSNLGLLNLLGGLGSGTNRTPSIEEFEDVRKYGQNLRDRQPPKDMFHWSQALATILSQLGGLHTLQRAYQMRPGQTGPGTGAGTGPGTGPGNNPPPPNTLTPGAFGLINGQFPEEFNLNPPNDGSPTLFRR